MQRPTLIAPWRERRGGHFRSLSLGKEPLQDVLGDLESSSVPDPADERNPDHAIVSEHATQAHRDRSRVENVLRTGMPVRKIEWMNVGADHGQTFERNERLGNKKRSINQIWSSDADRSTHLQDRFDRGQDGDGRVHLDSIDSPFSRETPDGSSELVLPLMQGRIGLN